MTDFDPSPNDRDLMRDLQQAWTDLGQVAPARELDQEDAETRRSIDWLRRAYLSQAPAAMPIRRIPGRPLLMRVAIAAALLVSGLILFTQRPFDSAGGDLERPSPSLKARIIHSNDERSELLAGRVRLTLVHKETLQQETDSPNPEARENR